MIICAPERSTPDPKAFGIHEGWQERLTDVTEPYMKRGLESYFVQPPAPTHVLDGRVVNTGLIRTF